MRNVLPLALLFCTLTAQSQSQPDQTEVAQFQKHALPRLPTVRSAMAESWVDPHQQLERAMITNAVIERQIALRRDTQKLLLVLPLNFSLIGQAQIGLMHQGGRL